jgi:hypothetical protein
MTGGLHRTDAQTLVEFSLGVTVFLMLLIGTIDLGRGAFMLNGVSQAAREIARETSVHPGSGGIGASPESVAAIGVQRTMVPGLETPSFECVDIAGTAIVGSCQPGDWVRVTVSTEFHPALPLLSLLGPFALSSTSSAEIQ